MIFLKVPWVDQFPYLSQKRPHYKQRPLKQQEEGDRVLNSMTTDDLQYIDDIVDINLGRLFYSSENEFRYVSSAHDLMVEWVHTIF